MNAELDEIYERWSKKEPDLWQKCYPKVYQGIGGKFASPKFVAMNLLSSILWFDEKRDTAPLSAIHAAYAGAKMIPYMVPSYFVEREFLFAMLGTELPKDLRWTDVPLPFEAGIIYIPTGCLKDPHGDDISALIWCRSRNGDVLRIHRFTDVQFSDDEFACIAVGEIVHQRAYSIAVHAEETPYMLPSEVDIPQGKMGAFDYPITKDDDEFIRNAAVTCMKILMSIQFRPQVLTQSVKVPGKKTKKGRGGRDIWTPNVVGKGYLLRTEHQGGTHASPRAHWRPAHWVHQAVGSIKNNPDFISINELPRDDEGKIDWPNITQDVIEKFWKCHKLTLIKEPILVMGK